MVAILSMVFMFAIIVFLKVTLHFVKKERTEHKHLCAKSTDRQARNWVRIHHVQINSIAGNIRKKII